jgi:hypothetical protein
MPFGKLGIVTLAGIVAVGLGGFGAALKGWSGSDDTVPAVTLADLDGRKDDGVDLLAAEDDDRDDKDAKKAKKAKKAKAKKQRANTNTNTNGGVVRAAPKASGGAAPAAPKPAPSRDWTNDTNSGGGWST